MKINLNELPSYIKLSKVYKILVSKNCNFIESKTTSLNKATNVIPIFKKSEIKTFHDYLELLKTLYFWKIDLETAPVTIFIYANEFRRLLRSYSGQYYNELSKTILKYTHDRHTVIEFGVVYNRYDYIYYLIDNNIVTSDVIFKYICLAQEDNVKMAEEFLKKYKIDIHMNKEDLFVTACSAGNINIVKFLLKISKEYSGKIINIHIDNEDPYRVSFITGNRDIAEYLKKISVSYSGVEITG